MSKSFENLLEQHKIDMEKINRQRTWWLYASSIVFVLIIFLIFGWDWLSDLKSRTIWWLVVSCMLIISVNWWYWTMSVVRIIIEYQETEYDLIKRIIFDIKGLKKDLQEFHDQTIDLMK